MQDETSICLFPLTVRDAVNRGDALRRPATLLPFLLPWIKASGFVSHPFGWFALSSFFMLTADTRGQSQTFHHKTRLL